MKLDKYSSALLIRKLYPGYTINVLKKDEISEEEIFWICRYGSEKEKQKLLDKFELNVEDLKYLIFWSDHETRELSMKKLSKIYYGRK